MSFGLFKLVSFKFEMCEIVLIVCAGLSSFRERVRPHRAAPLATPLLAKNLLKRKMSQFLEFLNFDNDFQLHALKIESKNLSSPTFFSNHPETFRICSKDHLQEMSQTEF